MVPEQMSHLLTVSSSPNLLVLCHIAPAKFLVSANIMDQAGHNWAASRLGLAVPQNDTKTMILNTTAY
jgi:hypothetical protein